MPPAECAVFRDALSQLMALRQIDCVWQTEEYAPGTTSINAGQQVTLWAEYEASVDWNGEAQTRRVLRVFESFLMELAGDHITPCARVLKVDGFAVDEARRSTMRRDSVGSVRDRVIAIASGIRHAFRRIDLLPRLRSTWHDRRGQ